jgi:hypothetical protein
MVFAGEETMAFAHLNKKGQTYYLHERMVTLRGNNRQQRIYFFALKPSDGALNAVPDGWQIVETASSGMPVLKKAVAAAK